MNTPIHADKAESLADLAVSTSSVPTAASTSDAAIGNGAASTVEERLWQVLVPARIDGTAHNNYIMGLVYRLFVEAQEPDGKGFDDLLRAIGNEVATACNGWPKPATVAYRWGGDMTELVDAAWRAYREAFDAFAGPQKFRHGSNYEEYHRAGIAGVVNYMSAALASIPKELA